jgi:hypothetical protein
MGVIKTQRRDYFQKTFGGGIVTPSPLVGEGRGEGKKGLTSPFSKGGVRGIIFAGWAAPTKRDIDSKWWA